MEEELRILLVNHFPQWKIDDFEFSTIVENSKLKDLQVDYKKVSKSKLICDVLEKWFRSQKEYESRTKWFEEIVKGPQMQLSLNFFRRLMSLDTVTVKKRMYHPPYVISLVKDLIFMGVSGYNPSRSLYQYILNFKNGRYKDDLITSAGDGLTLTNATQTSRKRKRRSCEDFTNDDKEDNKRTRTKSYFERREILINVNQIDTGVASVLMRLDALHSLLVNISSKLESILDE